jgi:hypothetical protein
VCWIHLAQGVVQCWAVVDGVLTVRDVRNLSPMELKYKKNTLNNNTFETRAEFLLFGGIQV